MNCGHLFAKRAISGGYGLLFVAARAKSWHMSWATAVKLLVKNSGTAYHQPIALVIATATSGKHTETSSRKSTTRRAAKRAERRRTSSGGTTHYASAWRALSERLYHSRSQTGCTRYVYDCSFTGTISRCFPPDFSTTLFSPRMCVSKFPPRRPTAILI